MTVSQAQKSMSSFEFEEWRQYDLLYDPGDPERGDLRAALIASTVANAFRGKKDDPISMDKFMLQFDRPDRPKAKKEVQVDIRKKLETWRSMQNEKSANVKSTPSRLKDKRLERKRLAALAAQVERMKKEKGG